MKRRVFYSFHYQPDNWRAAQVRNIGVIEGNQPAKDNDWEAVKRGGDSAIERWIDDQMKGRSCCIVLVGSATANRKWINYEIIKAWDGHMGVVGLRIDGLKNREGHTSLPGHNPFDYIQLGNQRQLSSVARCYDPQGQDSQERYDWISKYLANVVEEAMEIRRQA